MDQPYENRAVGVPRYMEEQYRPRCKGFGILGLMAAGDNK